MKDLTVALRTDEQTLFCDWKKTDKPTYHIWYSAGGNFQSRTAVTASMMSLQGAEIPAEIVVPHVMREVTAADCNPDRVDTDGVRNVAGAGQRARPHVPNG